MSSSCLSLYFPSFHSWCLASNGGSTIGQYRKNPQGFELAYVTNILSHYLLTLSLLPQIPAGGRIVNVTSEASYLWKTSFDPTNLDYSETIEKKENIRLGEDIPGPVGFVLYQRNKLLQIMFTREMQRRLDGSEKFKRRGISVRAYHPGNSSTSHLWSSALTLFASGLIKSSIWNRAEGLPLWENQTLQTIIKWFGRTSRLSVTSSGLNTDISSSSHKGRCRDRYLPRDG